MSVGLVKVGPTEDMTATIAQAPLSPEALKDYSGKWVAVRNGAVIAAALSFEDLKAHADVQDTDAIYHVPSDTSLFY